MITRELLEAWASALAGAEACRCMAEGVAFEPSMSECEQHVSMETLRGIAAACGKPIKPSDRGNSGAVYTVCVDYKNAHFWASTFNHFGEVRK